MLQHKSRYSLLLICAFVPFQLLYAHPGHEETGLLGGSSHFFTAWDHLFSFVAVGLLMALNAYQGGNSRPWWLAGFMGAGLLLGSLVAMSGVAVPAVDATLLFAVFLVAIALLITLNWSFPWQAGSVAVLALLSAYAHSIGTDFNLTGLSYMTGLFISAFAIVVLTYYLTRTRDKLRSVVYPATVACVALISAGMGVHQLI
jgi:urease accessory protein